VLAAFSLLALCIFLFFCPEDGSSTFLRYMVLTPTTDTHYKNVINRVMFPRMKMLPFVCPRERVIEYRLGFTSSGPLARLPTESFVRAIAARTSAPGGGSVAALLGALVSYISKF
jgi:hypothetical protein